MFKLVIIHTTLKKIEMGQAVCSPSKMIFHVSSFFLLPLGFLSET